ncbi:acetolactate synthase small subunit [Proteocatella sphenisci]|uniref:acetolactate synthase small subunit n=1 Tax=Proteocatella sphenisci TaxID=181070 RepID=UPI00048F6A6B|nr:acetolactate synthase small subunit [Proteocatella sphenisci]
MKKYVLVMIVYDHPGVLARISSLFCKKGFNINSITTSTTTEDDISRVTFSVLAERDSVEALIKQTEKLEEVRKTFILEEETSLFRELLLLKIKLNQGQVTDVKEIAEIFGARILDLNLDSLILELTGKESKIDAFINVMGNYQVIESCRTGVTGMERGSLTSSTDLKDTL